MNTHCPLCNSETSIFYRHRTGEYYACDECGGIHLNKRQRLSEDDERHRYCLHNNDVNDARYQQSVFPLTTLILNDFAPHDRGLDFGAGTGPVITKILRDHHYRISTYDPYFHDVPELLEQTYQYIVCCEVVEHFYSPLEEFQLLRALLSNQGILYCKTRLYKDTIDFSQWYYKNDATHVFFYRERTIDWIKNAVGFSGYDIINTVIKLVR